MSLEQPDPRISLVRRVVRQFESRYSFKVSHEASTYLLTTLKQPEEFIREARRPSFREVDVTQPLLEALIEARSVARRRGLEEINELAMAVGVRDMIEIKWKCPYMFHI